MRRSMLIAGWFGLCWWGLALAQAPADFPQRPVRFIVPYAPGGSSDVIARLLGQKLADALGQPFVVDNRPGAGSMIGTDLAARSAPDGYTIILSDMPHAINPSVHAKVYLSLNGTNGQAIVTSANLTVAGLKGNIELGVRGDTSSAAGRQLVGQTCRFLRDLSFRSHGASISVHQE